jgi:hypothetical protein
VQSEDVIIVYGKLHVAVCILRMDSRLDIKKCKLSVYHPGVFTKLNNMVFISQTHLYFVLNALFGQHVSTHY